MSDLHLYSCSIAAETIPELIAAVNGGTKPAAVTIGGTVVYFQAPDDRMRRHEAVHIRQHASFAPSWTKFLPERLRAWIGAPRFFQAYQAEHAKNGYEKNKYEIEARAAE